MAPDSEDAPQPNINIINIASDDAMWVLETDQDELLSVLADPVLWVKTNVNFDGIPAVLVEPFVVVFQHVATRKDSSTIKVQGLNQTAVMIVKLPNPVRSTRTIGTIFPQGEFLDVLQVDDSVHTHLHLSGFTKFNVAEHLLSSVVDPVAYLNALNQLPQRQMGVITPEPDRIIFTLDPKLPPHVIYQGWSPKGTQEDPPRADHETHSGDGGGHGNGHGHGHGHGGPPCDDSCTMATGDADAEGNVIVNGIVIKTYPLD